MKVLKLITVVNLEIKCSVYKGLNSFGWSRGGGGPVAWGTCTPSSYLLPHMISVLILTYYHTTLMFGNAIQIVSYDDVC